MNQPISAEFFSMLRDRKGGIIDSLLNLTEPDELCKDYFYAKGRLEEANFVTGFMDEAKNKEEE